MDIRSPKILNSHVKPAGKTEAGVARSGVFLFIVFAGLLSAAAASAATYFVVAGGGGNCSGSSWTNAAGTIPATLNPGDIVYLGGSAGNLANVSNTPCPGERTHTFSTSGTSSSHIQIIKCTSSIPACTSASGWQAGYGTNSAFWNDTSAPVSGGAAAFFNFCGNYYDVDGGYGASDQTGTYGIYMLSSSNPSFLNITPNNCGGAPLTDYTFKHMEIAGTSPNSLNGASGADALYVLGGTTSETISNISLNNMFIHDVFQPFSLLNVIGFTFHDSWVYRNFCNAAAHSQGLQSQSVGLQANTLSTSNLTIYNVVWRNIMGTGIVMCLSGLCDNWKIYNNIVWYDSTWNTANCSYGDSTARCAISKFTGDNSTGSSLTNAAIYGNTIAFAKNVSPCNCGADEAGIVVQSPASSNITVENNVWYSNTGVDIYTGVVPVNHDYNLVLNSPNTPYFTPNTHEMKTASGTADPFIASLSGNFHPANAGSNAPAGCSPGTNCLANGTPLASPYNSDLFGALRGGTSGWTEGAYQYGAGSSDTTPPTVAVTAPANGTTVSGAITVSGTAADNVAVASVQVSVDGGAYASASGTAAWTFSLNTTSLTNAAHTISAKATDTSGNISTAASISVTVNNAVFSPCDINKDGVTNVMDVQLDVNAALGVIACAPAYDLNQDGLCNVIDVQRVVNAALGGKCAVGP